MIYTFHHRHVLIVGSNLHIEGYFSEISFLQSYQLNRISYFYLAGIVLTDF